MDSKEVHPHTVTLSDLDSYASVLIASNKDGVCHRAVSCQFDEICNYKAVDSLLLPRAINEAKPQLNVVTRRNALMVRGLSLRRYTVIPIRSQQFEASSFRGKLAQGGERRILIDANEVAGLLASGYRGAPRSEQVSSVHKNGDAVHSVSQ